MSRIIVSMCVLISATALLFSNLLYADSVDLSFDTLYPETAAKQLHDTVLQLWSDVTLLHDQGLDEQHKKQLADLIVGQLVRIEYLLEHIQTKGAGLHPEDLAYLSNIVIALHNTYYHSFFSQSHVSNTWDGVCESFQIYQVL